MKKSRFASLYLTGKVASLPMLMGEARAQVTPTLSDVISTDLKVIEVPVGSAVRLRTIGADAYSSTSYGTTYAAVLCGNTGLPSTTTLVVTGVSAGDNVILAGASNKNDPVTLNLDKRLTLGAQGLIVLGSAAIANGPFNAPIGGSTLGSVAFGVPTAILTNLAATGFGKMYVQAAIVPAGVSANISAIAGWKFSELDEIQVGSSAGSTYCNY